MSRQIAEEIFEEVKLKHSQKGINSVPHSDEFLPFLAANLGIEIDKIKEIIKVLIKSHKIFSIEIVAQDKKRKIPRIEAYVEANLPTITRLKNSFQGELVKMYEHEYYKRVSFFQAVKDIIPKIRTLNNTPIGLITNKAIMLGEYEKLMENNFSEFTDTWKEKRFEEEMSKVTIIKKKKSEKKPDESEEPEEEKKPAKTKKNYVRAVETKKYNEFLSKSKGYPIDRILKIYGIDFFLRVHFRNYKFEYLSEIIERGNILDKKNLMILRDILFKVKMNFDKDPKLKNHRKQIQTLERVLSHSLYFTSRKVSK